MRRMLLLLSLTILGLALPLLSGCGAGTQPSFEQISAQEAAKIMEQEADCVIVDVRTRAEYDEGHIPGAICVPNESIGTKQPEALPDLEQTILAYCRSGRRSAEASEKLTAMGYTNVKDFGGILNWTGPVVTE